MEAHDCTWRDGIGCINARCPLHRAMRSLGACVAIGAGLCRSYDLGEKGMPVGPGRRWALPNGGVASIPDAIWRPGCGKAAP